MYTKRVIANRTKPDKDGRCDIYLSIKSLYYPEGSDVPYDVAENSEPIIGDGIAELIKEISKYHVAISLPILIGWEGEDYLKEYKP